MPVTRKSAISFALVHIPAELLLAIQDEDIPFNQLTRDMKRVRYRKMDGAGRESGNDDIGKIRTDKDNRIDILLFTGLTSIPTVYYDTSCCCVSGKGSEKAFELLQRAMKETGKLAIGKTVIGTRETMLALIPEKDGILLQTLYFHDGILDIPTERNHPSLNRQEPEMATHLIRSMESPFEPEKYHDGYQTCLKSMIGNRIGGKEVVAAKPGKVIDLTDTLKTGLEQNRPKRSPASRCRGG